MGHTKKIIFKKNVKKNAETLNNSHTLSLSLSHTQIYITKRTSLLSYNYMKRYAIFVGLGSE